mgnify:CR=1 FL=1
MIAPAQQELLMEGPAPARRSGRTPAPARRIPERFADWKLTPGGRYCLQRLYVTIAAFHRGMAHGEPKPSKRLVWETLRFRLDEVRARLKAKGHELKREGGFWLNDNFTALAFDHVKSRRPEFGFFEDRDHETSAAALAPNQRDAEPEI